MVDMIGDPQGPDRTVNAFRPVSIADPKWDPVNPRFDGDDESHSVGRTPDGQYVLLEPAPPHLGVNHRQVRLCRGDHAAELAAHDAAGDLAFLPGGPGCEVVVWASTLPK